MQARVVAVGGVWRSPAYVRLWSASVISALGSAVTTLALPLLAALTLNATPFQMGMLIASETAPILLLRLAAGGWVDRLRKRPLMVLTDIGRAALLLTERIGVRGVMLLSVLGSPLALLAIWFSPVRTLLGPPRQSGN